MGKIVYDKQKKNSYKLHSNHKPYNSAKKEILYRSINYLWSLDGDKLCRNTTND